MALGAFRVRPVSHQLVTIAVVLAGLYLLHGLWLNGWESREEVRRIKAMAAACEQWTYCKALGERALNITGY